MRGNGLVTAAILVAAGLGLALGYVPWAVTDHTAREAFHVGDFGDPARAAMAIGFGSFLVSMIAAYLIAASHSHRRRRGVAALILATTTAVVIGFALGGDRYGTDPEGLGGLVTVAAVVVLVVVSVGAAIGYRAGRPRQPQPR